MCHTTFSLLDGHGGIEKYAKRCQELQMGALAETDHGNIHGWMDFYHTCKEYDIKPILGIEAYQARKTRFDRDEEERAGPSTFEWEQRGPYHITLLAKNNDGYKNLIKLSSETYTTGFYVKPRCDHELIAEHSKGIIVLSGCLNGEVQQALLRGDYEAARDSAATMQDIVGKENYFIEIQDHGIDEQLQVKKDLLRLAKEIDAPVVPSGDCHYVHKEDADHHDSMLCVGTRSMKANEDRFKFAGPEFYLKSYDEMLPRFEPEWLDNSIKIADMVNIDLDFDNYYFPSYPDIPENETVDEHLDRLVWAGIEKRYGTPIPQDVLDRTTSELGKVKRLGYQEYFLVVADIVKFAKTNDIMVGPGRGSAAGCMLSYALEITNLDPIYYGLLFERFLVPETFTYEPKLTKM